MPYRMTRPEVAKRLAIKAMAEATPGTTYRNLARLFCTSFSAVRDALHQPIKYWTRMLAIAPAPSRKSRVKPVVSPVAGISTRAGKREHARLEKPEATINIPEPVNFDEEKPEIDQDAIDRETNDKIEDRDWKIRHGLIGTEEIREDP